MFEDDSLDDLRVEETSRGRKRPVKALTRERQRQIRRIAVLLADPDCSEETYLETINAFGLRDSPEYPQLRALWKRRRGGS
jgi:hypothetical protein